MYRVLLNVPRTCPIPALCWDLGGIQMRYRVIMNKLIFIWHLDNLEDSALAKQVYEVQKSQYLPGLVQECTEWIRNLNLPNLFKLKITKPRWKVLVKAAIKKENEDDLRTKMMRLEKLKRSELINENCEVKDYVRKLSAHDARTIFLKRTSMTRYVKMNYMHDVDYVKDMWRCDSCEVNIDSMSHVLWCQGYVEPRRDKNLDNDQDLARYLHNVMMIRSKLNLQK
jgi:hypothetical protein